MDAVKLTLQQQWNDRVVNFNSSISPAPISRKKVNIAVLNFMMNAATESFSNTHTILLCAVIVAFWTTPTMILTFSQAYTCVGNGRSIENMAKNIPSPLQFAIHASKIVTYELMYEMKMNDAEKYHIIPPYTTTNMCGLCEENGKNGGEKIMHYYLYLWLLRVIVKLLHEWNEWVVGMMIDDDDKSYYIYCLFVGCCCCKTWRKYRIICKNKSSGKWLDLFGLRKTGLFLQYKR